MSPLCVPGICLLGSTLTCGWSQEPELETEPWYSDRRCGPPNWNLKCSAQDLNLMNFEVLLYDCLGSRSNSHRYKTES